MPELIEKDRRGDKVYYEPALLKVSGVSKYNANQISFEGVSDFWTWTEWAASATGRADPLPVGTIAWFSLATNPKKGQNAKPGSLYRDITSVSRATEEQKAAYVSPAGSNGSYQDKELPAASQNGSGAQQPNHWDERERQIKLGMAFNNLTTMLSAVFHMTKPEDALLDLGFTEYGQATVQWARWYSQASRGLPLTPVTDEEEQYEEEPQSVADARELDEQAQSHLSDVPDEEEVPW